MIPDQLIQLTASVDVSNAISQACTQLALTYASERLSYELAKGLASKLAARSFVLSPIEDKEIPDKYRQYTTYQKSIYAIPLLQYLDDWIAPCLKNQGNVIIPLPIYRPTYAMMRTGQLIYKDESNPKS